MNAELLIRPKAETDLAEAFRWYEDRGPGLGERFLLSVEAVIAAIRRYLRAFAVVRKQVRRVLLRRFPYGVFYFLDGDTVVVLAVFHAKRHPRRWQDRV
jgi:plasmid stabilization system protein ParE